MGVEPEIDLFHEFDPELELARWRRRALFLTSIFLHIFLLIFIIFAPDIFPSRPVMLGIPVTPKKDQQITTLFLPPGSAEVAAPTASGSAPF